MKKVIYLPLIVLGLLSGLTSFAQDRGEFAERKNVINVNISSVAISHFGVSYERVLKEKMSVRLYVDFAGYNYNMNDDKVNINGFGIIPEFRYYVSKKGAPRGYFIGLYAPIRSYNIEGDVTDEGKIYKGSGKVSYVGFGFVNGPQWLLGDRISLAIPFGFSVGGSSTTGSYIYTNPETNQVEKTDLDIPLIGSAIIPRFSFELGIAF